MVLILSAHDISDNPTFEELNPRTHPTKKPISAAVEIIYRYGPRYLSQLFTDTTSMTNNEAAFLGNDLEIRKGLSDLKNFLTSAKSSAKKVVVLYHPEFTELGAKQITISHELIKQICRQLEIEFKSLIPVFSEALIMASNPIVITSILMNWVRRLLLKNFFLISFADIWQFHILYRGL